MQHCKNCGSQLYGQYCSHCGQHVKHERITFNYLWHELIHFFTHIQNGFLFTSWNMLIKPGITVKNFIEGKRKPYQPPVSYYLIWITLYLLFLYWIGKTFGENVVINYKDYFGPEERTRFALSHLSIVLTVVIPFQSLYFWLIITKKYYFYFETMIAIIYAIGTIILLQVAFAIIALFIHLTTGVSVDLQYSDILKALYLLWFTADLVKLYPVKLKLVKVIIVVILASATFTLWRLYGVPEITEWFM